MNHFSCALLCFVLVSVFACVSRAPHGGVDTAINQSEIHFESRTAIASKLDEISGLQEWRGHFLGFNDSGGESELYLFDRESGDILQTIELEGAKNRDWEDISIDDRYFYVGDCGNNYGNREDLVIYVVDHREIPPHKEDKKVKVAARKTPFTYADQHERIELPHNHDFDCESVVAWGDEVHLFSKEWKSYGTKHYVFSKDDADPDLVAVETYPIGYLVTAADMIRHQDSDSVTLALLGYTQDEEAFITLFTSLPGTDGSLRFFDKGAHVKRLYIGTGKTVGQVEGLCWDSSGTLWLSAESYGKVSPLPQAIMKMPIRIAPER